MGKPFDWKHAVKYGGYIVQFRFFDERRGESFFDTEFDVGLDSKAGRLVLTSEWGGSKYRGPAKDSGIVEALRPNTVVCIQPILGCRGRKKYLPSFMAKVVTAIYDEDGKVFVDYEQN